MHNRPITILTAFFLPSLVCCGTSCNTSALLNLTAPSANFVAGQTEPVPRALQVGFINNTPFRAIFSFGTYDQLDQESIPTAFGQLRLEGSTSSNQLQQPCRSTFSVGGDELIRLLNENDNVLNINDPRAVVNGVYFSAAPLGDPLEAEPTEGTAEGRVLLNGVDFSCRRTNITDNTGTGLLTFTFEQDAAAPGGFRIDYSFIVP